MMVSKIQVLLAASMMVVGTALLAGGQPVAVSVRAEDAVAGQVHPLDRRDDSSYIEKRNKHHGHGNAHHKHAQAHHHHHGSSGHHRHSSAKHHGLKHLADKQQTHSGKGDGGSRLAHAGGGLSNKVFAGACPHPNTDAEHPNGAPDFLACGISQKDQHSPWTPPHVTMQDIKIISSEQAANTAVFKPCAKYKGAFDRVAHDTGVPAVLLMSFALQESGCQASQIGPNGEFGLMQITPEKCGGAPGGNCRDLDFNIRKGAKYFKDQLDGPANGNILAAAGTYNGWKPGSMSYKSATNQQYGCAAQNNLDYLNSLFNGFCQGKDGYSNEFVKFGNLKKCGN